MRYLNQLAATLETHQGVQAMKRIVLFGLGLCILLYGNAFSGRLDLERRTYCKPLTHVRGKKGRKYVRYLSLRENLTGDKLAIFDRYGYTPHRLRFNFAGRITERWKYYSIGMEFTFNQKDMLISTRRFPPEDNHID
jgi:hypothetical protein